MRRLWTRFVYARSLLDADAYLPRAELPRDHLSERPLAALQAEGARGAPDAFDTIVHELVRRRAGYGFT